MGDWDGWVKNSRLQEVIARNEDLAKELAEVAAARDFYKKGFTDTLDAYEKCAIRLEAAEAENKRLGEERDDAREQRDFWSKRTGELEATNKIAVGQLVMLQHGKVLSKLDDKKGK